MLRNIINEDNNYTTLGIDAKRDKWLTKSNLVYVLGHSTYSIFSGLKFLEVENILN